MNAGAYGGEIKDVLAEVAFLDENRRLCRLPAAELALGYRTSVFEKKPWCIVEATFTLRPRPGGPRGDPRPDGGLYGPPPCQTAA